MPLLNEIDSIWMCTRLSAVGWCKSLRGALENGGGKVFQRRSGEGGQDQDPALKLVPSPGLLGFAPPI